MLRVLQFVADGSPGGGTTHVRQLLYGLRTEFEPALLTQFDSSLYRMSQEAGFRTYGGNFFSGRLSRIDPRCMRPIRDAVRDFRPDIVHCHGGRAAFVPKFFAEDNASGLHGPWTALQSKTDFRLSHDGPHR